MKRLLIVLIIVLVSCCDFAEACTDHLLSREVRTVCDFQNNLYRRGNGLGYHIEHEGGNKCFTILESTMKVRF